MKLNKHTRAEVKALAHEIIVELNYAGRIYNFKHDPEGKEPKRGSRKRAEWLIRELLMEVGSDD